MPVVLDDVGGVYFRPEGHGLLLVGLHAGNVVGGSPDRPLAPIRGDIVEDRCPRAWSTACRGWRRVRSAPDTAARTASRQTSARSWDAGADGPRGLYLACGFSGTGFKTAPAIGAALAELILDGRTTTADISPFALDRFAAGRPLVGEHPYQALWR